MIRTRVQDIREMGRSTQGVTLINLDEGTKLAGLERIVESEDENGANGAEGTDEGSGGAPAGENGAGGDDTGGDGPPVVH